MNALIRTFDPVGKMTNASNSEQMTSAGHKLSAGGHLDVHYLALKDEYDATLRAAGIRPGWSVLDAGAGNGVFLPLMAELLGGEGRIEAAGSGARKCRGHRRPDCKRAACLSDSYANR